MDRRHSDWREMVPHSGFDFHFSDNEWCWASFHMFVSHLYVFFGEMSIIITDSHKFKGNTHMIWSAENMKSTIIERYIKVNCQFINQSKLTPMNCLVKGDKSISKIYFRPMQALENWTLFSISLQLLLFPLLPSTTTDTCLTPTHKSRVWADPAFSVEMDEFTGNSVWVNNYYTLIWKLLMMCSVGGFSGSLEI